MLVSFLVLGCLLGAFWEPKIYQHATYECLILIDFLLVFPLLLRLGGSYVGSISVLFSHCFLHRFLVDLGVDFGVILGGFGGSKSLIFGIDFLLIFACACACLHVCACVCVGGVGGGEERPKSGQEGPKSGLRAAKRGPRAAKSSPRAAQERPKAPKERQKERTSKFGGPSKRFSNKKACKTIT